MSNLLPEGVTSIADCPFPLHEAISIALRTLRWEENLMPDEMPPKRIWLDGKKLEQWFEEVEDKRRKQYGLDAPRSNGRGDWARDYGGGEENAMELIKRGR